MSQILGNAPDDYSIPLKCDAEGRLYVIPVVDVPVQMAELKVSRPWGLWISLVLHGAELAAIVYLVLRVIG